MKERVGLSDDQLRSFEQRLGYRFEDPSLLLQALTHRSLVGEGDDGTGSLEHYERLEFLGDAVLGLVAAEWLYSTRPEEAEGQLARLKSFLVSATVLAKWARKLDVGSALILGTSEERTGGRDKKSLLADSMEAVFGAVFLDRGLEGARPVILAMLESAQFEDHSRKRQDAKTRLQELLQAEGRDLPDYRQVGESGPDHDRTFYYECWIDGQKLGEGRGPTKKAAEREAARRALDVLR